MESGNGVAVAALRTLTVTKAGNGSGTVTSAPAGISCGVTCSFTFNQGEAASLTATPAPHMEFTGWSGGACTGLGVCEVTLGGANAAVTATFAPIVHELTVTSSVPVRERSSHSGGDRMRHPLRRGLRRGRDGHVDRGRRFRLGIHRLVGCLHGVGPCLVTLDGDQAVVAGFAKKASEGGGGSNTPPSSGTSHAAVERVARLYPARDDHPSRQAVKKKPLQCKRGFHKLKQKGKVRCVKVKPKHEGGRVKPKRPKGAPLQFT